MNDYINVLKTKYADFSGRARRREYWMFVLFNIIFAIATMLVDGVLFAALGIAFLNIVYSLAMLVPGIAVTVRRLHDTGRSGWWILVALVPVVGPLALLVILCLDSQPGTNQFGSSPKGAASATAGLAAA
ncbi:MAG: DUF805 domain-containing protein [Pirellulaceae bacterium]|nr:DUF805 domain-containing protein [Planctomycetales bacterium]